MVTTLLMPCLICGRKNNEHMVYWSPVYKWYQRHILSEIEQIESTLVPGSDHYACIDNLDYLEYLEKKHEERADK